MIFEDVLEMLAKFINEETLFETFFKQKCVINISW